MPWTELWRETGRSSPAGARLDVQTDAALVLVLSCAAVRSLGPLVLAVGLMWYAFVAAGQIRPLAGCAEAEQAAEGYRRLPAVRFTAGALTRCARTRHGSRGLALLTLAASFGRDVLELERTHRRPVGHGSGAENVN